MKSADQKKKFNFFANFVPSFPENESERYESEPEIKFLLSRKTSATKQKGGRATHARGTDARSPTRDWAHPVNRRGRLFKTAGERAD